MIRSLRGMLHISPNPSKFDTAVRISLEGFKPHQPVTICSRVLNGPDAFGSFAHYFTTDEGSLDVGKHTAVGGNYTGVSPMGLFSFLKPLPGQRRGLRLMPKSVLIPMVYKLAVFNGHLESPWDPSVNPVATEDCERFILDPLVERRQIRVGRLRGTLFVPKNSSTRLPAVVDLYGTAGGLVEYRAALLASHGLVVLALAYFNFEDLPDGLQQIHMEYFEEAIDWLSNQPEVDSNAIGMIGISLGADLCINTAIISPKVKRVVSINAFHTLDSFAPIKYGNRLVCGMSLGDVGHMEIVDEVLKMAKYKGNFEDKDTHTYPIERSAAQFLFICGADDSSNPSVDSALKMVARLEQAGKHNYEQIIYHKTGHLIEPPYIPPCNLSFHKVVDGLIHWGGSDKEHADAQNNFWSAAVRFLRTGHTTPISRL